MPRRPPSRHRYTRRQRRAKAAVRGLWTFLMPGLGLVVAWAADLSNVLGCSEYITLPVGLAIGALAYSAKRYFWPDEEF